MKKLNPNLEVLLAAIIWGSSGIFIKTINLPSTSLTFFRAFVPSIIILVYFLATKFKFSKVNLKLMIFASIINAVRVLFYFLGFNKTSVGNAVIILYTGPIFITILSALVLKEKLSRKLIISLLIAFSGVLIIFANKEFSFNNSDFVGMLYVMLSAIIYAFFIVIFKKEITKYTKLEGIFYQNIAGAIIFLPFLFINQPFPNTFQISASIVYASLIGLVAFGLYYSAIKRIDVSRASVITYAEILSGVILAVIFLGEEVTLNMVIGGALIVTGVSLIQVFKKKKEFVESEYEES